MFASYLIRIQEHRLLKCVSFLRPWLSSRRLFTETKDARVVGEEKNMRNAGEVEQKTIF